MANKSGGGLEPRLAKRRALFPEGRGLGVGGKKSENVGVKARGKRVGSRGKKSKNVGIKARGKRVGSRGNKSKSKKGKSVINCTRFCPQ